MNQFDGRAATWDENPVHLERSKAVSAKILEKIPVSEKMTALEFGAGTGLLSLQLKDKFSRITMVDSSSAMVYVMLEKISDFGIPNMEAYVADPENGEISGSFDVVYTQMTLHHIKDISAIIKKLSLLIKPGGYLAVADLYTEDGSFHGELEDVHKGFDPDDLALIFLKTGFSEIQHEKVFTIRKEKDYPVFLITGKKI